jgi:hypothetical protein
MTSLRTRTPAAGDRAHGELLLARDAELADDEDIEREMQRARDLIGDRDATTRKAQDNRVVPVCISCKARCEHTAGLEPVVEGTRGSNLLSFGPAPGESHPAQSGG